MRNTWRAAVSAGLALWLGAAAAQTSPGETVYRCGPDGRSYSSMPCTSGKSVDVADPRSDEQRRQAEASAQRERQLADKLTADRVQRDKSTIPAAAGHIGPHAAASAAAAKPTKASGKPKKKKKGKPVDPTLSDPVRGVTPKK